MKAISLTMRIIRSCPETLVINACKPSPWEQMNTQVALTGLSLGHIEYESTNDRLTNFWKSHERASTECFGSPATTGLAPAAQLGVRWAECMPPPVQSDTQNSSQSNSMRKNAPSQPAEGDWGLTGSQASGLKPAIELGLQVRAQQPPRGRV
eukprot:scaffold33059_cov17-Prasinocladus_malaysianus.AAC.1